MGLLRRSAERFARHLAWCQRRIVSRHHGAGAQLGDTPHPARFLCPAVDYPDYDPASAVTPLTAAELGNLDILLQTLPADGVMSLDGLDGYLTALLVGPGNLLKQLPSAEWLPLIWGGDGPGGNDEVAPFASKRQRKATVVLVLRHLRHISQQISQAPQDWEPIFSVAEEDANGPADAWADARDWCTGFLQAVDLLPSAWEAAWHDAALGPALAPLLVLGGGLAEEPAAPPAGEHEGELDDAETCDGLSRAVPDAVLQLLAWRSVQGS